ncbi:hypothetical protein BDV93DRAFT_517203 [Ceratobasidium sp. AG-I]|nr:hypothetical protein BDV93DRAFT_517203 [Ceratobasidium sp. AG-I]
MASHAVWTVGNNTRAAILGSAESPVPKTGRGRFHPLRGRLCYRMKSCYYTKLTHYRQYPAKAGGGPTSHECEQSPPCRIL